MLETNQLRTLFEEKGGESEAQIVSSILTVKFNLRQFWVTKSSRFRGIIN